MVGSTTDLPWLKNPEKIFKDLSKIFNQSRINKT